MSNEFDFTFKVVVVGNSGVGKTTMVQRFVTGKFLPFKKTIGADLSSYTVRLDEHIKVRLQIWDFAGQAKFKSILPSYVRGATGCVLCYDITTESSFQILPQWHETVVKNTENTTFLLVGCKQDLEEKYRRVDYSRAQEFQKKYGISLLCETSSKTGYNNDLVFKELAKHIIKNNFPDSQFQIMF